MKFVADENISRSMVDWLRGLGHEVFWVVRDRPSISDETVSAMAREHDAVLITHDLGFGKMVIFHGGNLPGLILLRLDADHTREELACLRPLWPQIESACFGRVVVVEREKIRVRPMEPMR